MRLSGKTARMTLFAILFCLVCSRVFATAATPMASTHFSLVHSINVDPVFHFEFRNTSGAVNDVELPVNTSNYKFASLYLIHNRTLLVSTLTVSATDLTCDSNFFPYTMVVKDSQGKTVSWTPAPSGHGSGSAIFVSSAQSVTYNYENTDGTAHIADFYITLYTFLQGHPSHSG